jgi:hypothetical protein
VSTSALFACRRYLSLHFESGGSGVQCHFSDRPRLLPFEYGLLIRMEKVSQVLRTLQENTSGEITTNSQNRMLQHARRWQISAHMIEYAQPNGNLGMNLFFNRKERAKIYVSTKALRNCMCELTSLHNSED